MEKILELKHISKSFGGIKALQDVSFEVFRNEILGLIGPNGSGKSTCVNVISGVYHQDSGQILLDGQEIDKSVKINKRVKLGLSRTFQTPKPFCGLSVFDNVFTVALQRHSLSVAKEKTQVILDSSGLQGHADLPSEKLPIEKRKWLDLARTLALEPQIVMMDEVMAGLNPTEMAESLNLVRKIRDSGVTILFIEHVMKAVINICERVVVLNEGKVLCSGEPKEVLEREDVCEAYLGVRKNASH